jgi:hypothetical protein
MADKYELDDDYSSVHVSIEVRRTIGVLDSNDTNSTRIISIEDS